jgi:hypothetical protein
MHLRLDAASAMVTNQVSPHYDYLGGNVVATVTNCRIASGRCTAHELVKSGKTTDLRCGCANDCFRKSAFSKKRSFSVNNTRTTRGRCSSLHEVINSGAFAVKEILTRL